MGLGSVTFSVTLWPAAWYLHYSISPEEPHIGIQIAITRNELKKENYTSIGGENFQDDMDKSEQKEGCGFLLYAQAA